MLTTFTANADKRIFKGYEADTEVGEIECSIAGNTLAINHTRVPKEHQGKGYAAALTKAVVEHVRQNPPLKIKPVCTYSVAFFARHPEYDTFLTKE